MKSEIKKLPPLECPKCQSTSVSKDKNQNIYCENCNTKTFKNGKTDKLKQKVIQSTKGRNYPEGFWE